MNDVEKRIEKIRKMKDATEAIIKILKKSNCDSWEIRAILKNVQSEVCIW